MIESTNAKMKVEIWSDVTCGFCYIGKRKFEDALSVFKNASNIEIIWRSFQLAPEAKSERGKSFYQALSEHSGMSIDQSKSASDQLTHIAAKMGLVYDFEKAISVNTFNAHRFSHFAKDQEVQTEAEEVLFKAYFTDGKNIDDVSTLVELGGVIGLNEAETKTILEGDHYADEVRVDLHRAQQIGVTRVPTFVIDGKHTFSGVQQTEAFLQTLEVAYGLWLEDNRITSGGLASGESCSLDGLCK